MAGIFWLPETFPLYVLEYAFLSHWMTLRMNAFRITQVYTRSAYIKDIIMDRHAYAFSFGALILALVFNWPKASRSLWRRLVGVPRLELELDRPKRPVLPLHHTPYLESILAQINIVAGSAVAKAMADKACLATRITTQFARIYFAKVLPEYKEKWHNWQMHSGMILAVILLAFLAAILFSVIRADGGIMPTLERYHIVLPWGGSS